LALAEFCDAISLANRDLLVEFLGDEGGRILLSAWAAFRIERLPWLDTGMQGRAAITDLVITLPLPRARRALGRLCAALSA
jgi:hypothetical protein